MCVRVTQQPTASPASLSLPGTVIIRFRLQSASPTTVRITYRAGAMLQFRRGGVLLDEITDTVSVDGSKSVALQVELVPSNGDGRGAHRIEILLEEDGCAAKRLVVGVTGVRDVANRT